MTGLPLVVVAVLVPGMAVLAALGLARALERRERSQTRRAVRDLAEQIEAFVVGRIDSGALRRAVAGADPESFWGALEGLTLGRRRGQRRALSEALAGNPHARRERRALRDDSPWRRELAARRLALLTEPASRRALRAALERGPAAVALAAAMALARHRDGSALRWLIAHPEALAGRTPRARVGVLRAFGRGALPVLAEALERGVGDAALERALIETLGLGGDARATAAIGRRLASAEAEVRVAAARALGRLGAAEATGALVAALDDAAWPVRAVAAWSLGRLAAPGAIEALAARLTDRAWWVRRHAAYALWEIGEDGRAALRRIVETSPDPYARDMAREALGDGTSLGAA